MKKFLIVLLLSMFCSVYAQTNDRETLTQLNKTVVALYENQKFDEALKIALQALDLSVKVYGAETVETAGAYTNLGIIYRDKRKFDASIENLRKAADIYEKNSGYKSEKSVSIYTLLANSQFSDGRKKEAETNYLKAVEIAESNFGKKSKESLSPTILLAGFYSLDKKFAKSNETYLKGYAIAVKNFGNQSSEIERIENARSCAAGRDFACVNSKAFDEAREKILGKTDEQGIGIINGKAKSLPIPRYPVEAREQRLGGSVSVRVKINEQGNVSEAKAVCGHPVLAKASEEAAKGAKFESTVRDGKPVKVSGIVIYSYVP